MTPAGVALLGELVTVRHLRLVGRAVAVVGDEVLVQPARRTLPACWFPVARVYASDRKAT